ncbi:MAG TPA: ParB/RepB/Spo0J family partition protein [Gemmatimonadales bacterium]|jgi:ParB family chromosome partitioning protein
MTENKRRLGRGLEALLGSATTVERARDSGQLRELPLNAIRPNHYQPRQAFDPTALQDLATSLRENGLLQPVVVRADHDDTYELIAGERRVRAAQQLGWERIGAVIRDVDDRTMLTLALVENLQRDALSPIDEAKGYRRLIDDFAVTQGEVGDLVGRDRTTVTNALRLLKLPDEVQSLIHDGALSAGHARALLALGSSAAVLRAARIVVEQGMSVRDAERMAQTAGRKGGKRGPRRAKPEVRRLEDALRRRLQTDISISARGKDSGRLSINFYSQDDLARILEIILGEPYEE